MAEVLRFSSLNKVTFDVHGLNIKKFPQLGLERWLELLLLPEDLDLVPSTHQEGGHANKSHSECGGGWSDPPNWAPEPWLSIAPSTYLFGNQLLRGKMN